MRYLSRFAIASFVAVPVIAGSVRAQGHDMAIDFRMTEKGMSGGKPVNSTGTGHAVVSGDRVRYDMTGNTRAMAMPGMTQGDNMTLIMLDSGKTFLTIDPAKKQYMRMRPAETMEQMQKMMEGMGAAMKFDITGSDPKVEKIGGGPDILGHHTTHFRISGTMKVSMAAMGESQGVEMSSIVDEYVSPDIKTASTPFRDLGSNVMGGMFGSSFKTYMDKMKAARTKVPGFPLRSETHVITTAAAQASDMTTVQEITALHMITASPSLFEVPAGYTEIKLPNMQTMPPRRTPAPSTKH